MSSRAKKHWGQHFLKDRAAARRIVEAAEAGPLDLVIEIGPGRGALTSMLAEGGGRVVGVEIDPELCAVLTAQFGENPRVRVLNASLLDVDLAELVISAGNEKAVVVGNLPYYLTGPILQHLIRFRVALTRCVLMVQREVAERLQARSGKAYGILSISIQLYAEVKTLFDLPPDRFSPAPAVHSSVVCLEFRERPLVELQNACRFFEVVRTAFQQRRKMLKNTLPRLVGNDATLVAAVCREAGVDPQLRPEAVTPEDYERIARAIAAIRTA